MEDIPVPVLLAIIIFLITFILSSRHQHLPTLEQALNSMRYETMKKMSPHYCKILYQNRFPQIYCCNRFIQICYWCEYGDHRLEETVLFSFTQKLGDYSITVSDGRIVEWKQNTASALHRQGFTSAEHRKAQKLLTAIKQQY